MNSQGLQSQMALISDRVADLFVTMQDQIPRLQASRNVVPVLNQAQLMNTLMNAVEVKLSEMRDVTTEVRAHFIVQILKITVYFVGYEEDAFPVA